MELRIFCRDCFGDFGQVPSIDLYGFLRLSRGVLGHSGARFTIRKTLGRYGSITSTWYMVDHDYHSEIANHFEMCAIKKLGL